MPRHTTGSRRGAFTASLGLGLLCPSVLVLGCDDEAVIITEGTAPTALTPSLPAAPEPRADAPPASSKYVSASVVFSPEGELTYIHVLDSLGPQTLDPARSIELPGWADIWVHEGFLFVSSGESPIVTKYSVTDDGALVEEGALSFASYGEVDVAFWSNTFVAPDKAYMINGVGGYVIWNPASLAITGTFDLPALPAREGLLQRAGTLDRSNVIRDGILYQPMYWSDEDYAVFAPDSRIVAIDIARDEVVNVIEAPCSGLDIGTRDAAGNLYFSTWTSGIYQPLVLGSPGNCVATIPAGSDSAGVAFSFADIAAGREGSAVRAFTGSSLLLSVFHDERVDIASAEDPWAVIAERNWRTWLYDPASGAASAVDALDWNSGATYVFVVDGRHHVLVPSTDYAATTVVALNDDLSSSIEFEMRGWGTRLFKLR